MPKLSNVTDTELTALVEELFGISQEVHDLCRRIQQGYCEPVTEPIHKASGLLSASRALADLAAQLLVKAKFAEIEEECRRRITERASK